MRWRVFGGDLLDGLRNAVFELVEGSSRWCGGEFRGLIDDGRGRWRRCVCTLHYLDCIPMSQSRLFTGHYTLLLSCQAFVKVEYSIHVGQEIFHVLAVVFRYVLGS